MSLHRSTGRGKSGSGQSSNVPPTPWVPPLWKEQYENIRKMRETRNAPVDTHGCFMLAEKDVPPEVRKSNSHKVCSCDVCFIGDYWCVQMCVWGGGGDGMVISVNETTSIC